MREVIPATQYYKRGKAAEIEYCAVIDSGEGIKVLIYWGYSLLSRKSLHCLKETEL